MCICQYVCWFFELSEGFVLICNMFYSLEVDVTVSLSPLLCFILSYLPFFLCPSSRWSRYTLWLHPSPSGGQRQWHDICDLPVWQSPHRPRILCQVGGCVPWGYHRYWALMNTLAGVQNTREYTHTQTHRSTSTPEAHNAVAVQHLI